MYKRIDISACGNCEGQSNDDNTAGSYSESYSLFKRDVLVSIHPQYVRKILRGSKTIELRKRFPREKVIGSHAFIYSTSPTKAVVAHGTISDVAVMSVEDIWTQFKSCIGITRKNLTEYFANQDYGYAIFLSDVRVLSEPVHIDELRDIYGINPPQSYRYIDGFKRAIEGNESIQTTN